MVLLKSNAGAVEEEKSNSRVMTVVITSLYVTTVCREEHADAMIVNSSDSMRQVLHGCKRDHSLVMDLSEGILNVFVLFCSEYRPRHFLFTICEVVRI